MREIGANNVSAFQWIARITAMNLKWFGNAVWLFVLLAKNRGATRASECKSCRSTDSRGGWRNYSLDAKLRCDANGSLAAARRFRNVLLGIDANLSSTTNCSTIFGAKMSCWVASVDDRNWNKIVVEIFWVLFEGIHLLALSTHHKKHGFSILIKSSSQSLACWKFHGTSVSENRLLQWTRRCNWWPLLLKSAPIPFWWQPKDCQSRQLCILSVNFVRPLLRCAVFWTKFVRQRLHHSLWRNKSCFPIINNNNTKRTICRCRQAICILANYEFVARSAAIYNSRHRRCTRRL